MKANKMVLLPAMAASLMMITSCGDYTGKEKTHPLYVKAGTAKQAGEYQDAAKSYEEFLMISPRSSLTHLELANLYNDNLNNPLKAIYHYQKWLDMNPQGSADTEDIKVFIENARKNLFKQLKEEYKNDPDASADSAKIAKYQQEITHMQEINRNLTNRFRELLQQNEALKRGQKNPGRAPAAASAKTSNPATASSAVRKTTASAGKETTYKVVAGDTLMKISEKVYGSRNYYRLILNANKGKIRKDLRLQPGQVLRIPPKPAQ